MIATRILGREIIHDSKLAFDSGEHLYPLMWVAFYRNDVTGQEWAKPQYDKLISGGYVQFYFAEQTLEHLRRVDVFLTRDFVEQGYAISPIHSVATAPGDQVSVYWEPEIIWDAGAPNESGGKGKILDTIYRLCIGLVEAKGPTTWTTLSMRTHAAGISAVTFPMIVQTNVNPLPDAPSIAREVT